MRMARPASNGRARIAELDCQPLVDTSGAITEPGTEEYLGKVLALLLEQQKKAAQAAESAMSSTEPTEDRSSTEPRGGAKLHDLSEE
jgi:hypothetical protein